MNVGYLVRSLENGKPTTLGDLARNLRIESGKSEKQIAKLADVSENHVSLLEDNKPLPLDEKRKIMAVLFLQKANRFD